MTTREPSGLRRLKEQYRQVVLREEIREKILQAISQPSSSADRSSSPIALFPRSTTRRIVCLGAVAVAVCALFVWGLGRTEKLDVVVSAVHGQAFSEGTGTRLLGPDSHVVEGRRLRTSASSTLETKVGANTVAVGADSSLLLESLNTKELKFRLEHGWVTLSVAPLSAGKRLWVYAGDLSVEVVGTKFTVKREGACSSVSVRSGRVATTYKGIAVLVGAGEERQFCPSPVETMASASIPALEKKLAQVPDAEGKVVRETMGKPAPRPSVHEVPLPAKQGGARTLPPAEMPVARTEVLSDEERLFRAASRTEGDAGARADRLQEYLARFPNGMFTEEALFQLVRGSYAGANPSQVVRFSEQFLRRFHRGRRVSEVQLLYVQSRIEMGQPPGQSLPVLESLLSHLGSLPRNQREQATYLAILAYCGSTRPQLCRQWTDRYLQQYPHGLYADQVRRSQGERVQDP
jgi:ferric-dicitrate binding protein FerR (iron transport regulator)